ncbi:hypothetical protein M011DRAFT_484069 [Sporormia fimetaria CBS 119925]|uniref:Uncharacterized protein n=1 Tax=Sporormia fimetaria CBS 119925 TaxID=1340428 RepID=A0A6A6VLW4_9PLEO|nr:hypothetical protein M011DRAFT_484069 [Sporormia fimetaria CBS 119925]
MRRSRTRGLTFFFLISGAYAFGTINEPNVIGQHCEHERITRVALGCPLGVTVSDGRCFEEESLHQLAGRSGPAGAVGQGSNGAVGAPDMLDPTPEGPEAHCDNADFLDSPKYPRTREEATEQLQTCVNHLRLRFLEGIDAANKIVDDDARIILSEVDITRLDCRFSFPELQMHVFSRSKCSAIEGFGRSLHGVQDFYAHSNWADDAKPPYTPENPPGLRRSDYPIFLDLRAENNISEQVPYNLTTGCFGGVLTDGTVGKPGNPLEPGSQDCSGRITHGALNKDNGVIDEVTGLTKQPGPNTPRSDFRDNFERAVAGAIRDSRRQWRHFREEIRRTYGVQRGNMIICGLVRDNPAVDCYGRKVAILRDAPSDNNRMAELQMPRHRWLLEELEGRPHEEGEGEGLTPQNSTKSRGASNELRQDAEAEPQAEDDVSEESPPVSEGLDIGNAVEKLLRNNTAFPANKTAVVALTNASEKRLIEHLPDIWRAGDAGLRVHIGVLSPAGNTRRYAPREEDFMTGVLRTGGTYSVLHNRASIPRFLDHVISRGLTQYDNAGDTETLLVPGLSIRDFVTPAMEPRRYSIDAHSIDNAVISVAPITANLGLHVRVRHVRTNEAVEELDIGLGGNKTFRVELGIADIPRTDAWFELEVAHARGSNLAGGGLFEVSIEAESVDMDHEPASMGHDEL